MQKLFRLGLMNRWMWFMFFAAHSEPTSPSIEGVEWESKTHAANWNKLAENSRASFVRCFCLFRTIKIENKWKCVFAWFPFDLIASHYILVSIHYPASDELSNRFCNWMRLLSNGDCNANDFSMRAQMEQTNKRFPMHSTLPLEPSARISLVHLPTW